jgi:hypothetical protein
MADGGGMSIDQEAWDADLAWLIENHDKDVSVVDAEIFAEKVFDFMRLGQLSEEAARQAALRLIRSKEA